MTKALDPFALCNPEAVRLARQGKVIRGAATYANGSVHVEIYIKLNSLNNKAKYFGKWCQEEMNKSSEAREFLSQIDNFVLATRDLPMSDEMRRDYGALVSKWRDDWRNKFGVWSQKERARRRALYKWQFMKAARKEGLIS